MLKCLYDTTKIFPKCGLIFINFAENHLGCSHRCPFCVYSILDWNTYWCPNAENIIEYLKLFPQGASISISGGGDPLYQLNKNENKLKEILSTIKDNNYHIDIVTTEWSQIPQYWNTLQLVDSWSFSIEYESIELLNIVKFLREQNKDVRITKLANPIDNVDYQRLQIWVDFYKLPHVRLILRENFSKPLSEQEHHQLRNWCQQQYNPGLKFNIKNLIHLVLINDEVWDSGVWYEKMDLLAKAHKTTENNQKGFKF